MRDYAGKLLPAEAVNRCGRFATGDDAEGFVDVRVGPHAADYRGLVTCGSVWHCPICAAKISARRREEIATILNGHTGQGGAVWMMTLTVPHHAFSNIAELRPKVAEAFRWLQQGREWKAAKDAIGFVGSIRAMEVTHGGAGWHPHLHVLVLCNSQDDDAVRAFGRIAFDRWSRALERAHMGAPSPAAFDFSKAVQVEDAGHYIAKGSVERELVSGHTKRAKKGSRSPWQILLDASETSDTRDIELFQEYAAAFKGAKQLTWSKGLRQLYGVEETEDEAIAAQEAAAAETRTVARISIYAWNHYVRPKRLQTAVLDAAERFPQAELIYRLSLMGVPADLVYPGDPLPVFDVVKL